MSAQCCPEDRGWFRNVETLRIERCDDCRRFGDDDEARARAVLAGDKLAAIESAMLADDETLALTIESVLALVVDMLGLCDCGEPRAFGSLCAECTATAIADDLRDGDAALTEAQVRIVEQSLRALGVQS